MSTREVLVSLPHADGTAAVVRHQTGELCLIGDLAEGCAAVLQGYQPAREGLIGDRTVQGGRLPPTAVAAEVVDDTGARLQAAAANGAWVVVLDQATRGWLNPVRFVDARGDTVAPPLPDDWPRSPVDDAEEPCPACGACAWEEVHPLDESRGMRGSGGVVAPPGALGGGGRPLLLGQEPCPFVVCRVCGHEESVGVWFAAEAPPTPEDEDPEEAGRRARQEEETARLIREYEEARRRREREALAELDLPVYAAEGWPARLAGHGGGSRHRIERVTIRQGAATGKAGPMLHVETAYADASYEGERALVRRALEGIAGEGDSGWPNRSEAGMTVWLQAWERERRRRGALAKVVKRPLLVDGEPEDFELGELTGRWAAVRRGPELVLTVTAIGVAPEAVTLRQVVDPARALLDEPID